MARTCGICRHESRGAIDAALVGGTSLRDVAGQYGVSRSALHRHRIGDLPRAIVRAKEAEEVLHGEKLLDQVRHLIGKANGILDRAENDRTALMAIREVRGTLELLARITGQLNAPIPESAPAPLFALPPGSEIAIAVRPPREGTQHSSSRV